MDSDNKNQREDNYQDLRGQEAVEKIKEMVKQAANLSRRTEGVPPNIDA